MKVHVVGRELFVLIYTVGCLAVPQNKVSYEWFRLFYIHIHIVMIHIGRLIEEELRRQGRSVSWFAERLYCDRTNVYSIFKRKSLDTDLLLRISQILNYNFFNFFLSEFNEYSSVSENDNQGKCRI